MDLSATRTVSAATSLVDSSACAVIGWMAMTENNTRSMVTVARTPRAIDLILCERKERTASATISRQMPTSIQSNDSLITTSFKLYSDDEFELCPYMG